MALVLSIVRGETSVAEAARKHALTVAEIEEWQERLLAAAENALDPGPRRTRRSRTSQIENKTPGRRGEHVELLLDAGIVAFAAMTNAEVLDLLEDVRDTLGEMGDE